MSWCPNCGTEYREGFEKCADCGVLLTDKNKGSRLPHAEVFIGENYEYYKSKWDSHMGDFFKGWNWAAFFFGMFWLAYRKLYLEAAISIMLILIVSQIDSSGGSGFGILFGAIGNGLYFKKYQRLLDKNVDKKKAEINRIMAEKGGTSVLGIFIILGLIVLSVVVSVFLN